MNALPMVTRCADAQWRGLTDEERRELRGNPVLRWIAIGAQVETPIWTVSYALGYSLTVLSVKDDVLG